MSTEKVVCETCHAKSAVLYSDVVVIEKRVDKPAVTYVKKRVYRCPSCHTLKHVATDLTKSEFIKLLESEI